MDIIGKRHLKLYEIHMFLRMAPLDRLVLISWQKATITRSFEENNQI